MGVKHSLRILTVFCVALTCGCSHFQEWRANGKVGPDHRAPTANVACEWQQFNSPYVIAGQNAVTDDSWWGVFNDPEILRFVDVANSGYLPLKSAMLRVQEQCFIRNIAVGNLFPQQQEAFGRYNRLQFGENGNQFGIPGFGQSFDLYEVGFNASWEIDVWGRLRRLVESSAAEVQASVEDVHDVRLSLTADVVSSYTLIRVLQQRIQIARDQVKAQQETLRLAEVRLKNGSSTKLDVTQATAIVESTKATIPQLESELRQANNQLCLLLGVPTQVLFDEGNIGDIPGTPEQVVVGLPRDLLRRRPDIRRAERKVAAQSAQIGVAAAELFPKFALRGTINWQSFKLSNLIESASNGGAIVPGFAWNLLNYGRLKNQVCVEKTRLEQALVAYRQAVLNANAEVEDALTAFVKKKEEIAAIQQAVEATRESLEIATKQYREGSVDLDRVNNLRKDLIRQLDLETAAQGQAAIALIRVYKTMGGGWQLGSGSVVSPQPLLPTPAADPTTDSTEEASEESESTTPTEQSDFETDLEDPMPQATDLEQIFSDPRESNRVQPSLPPREGMAAIPTRNVRNQIAPTQPFSIPVSPPATQRPQPLQRPLSSPATQGDRNANFRRTSGVAFVPIRRSSQLRSGLARTGGTESAATLTKLSTIPETKYVPMRSSSQQYLLPGPSQTPTVAPLKTRSVPLEGAEVLNPFFGQTLSTVPVAATAPQGSLGGPALNGSNIPMSQARNSINISR